MEWDITMSNGKKEWQDSYLKQWGGWKGGSRLSSGPTGRVLCVLTPIFTFRHYSEP